MRTGMKLVHAKIGIEGWTLRDLFPEDPHCWLPYTWAFGTDNPDDGQRRLPVEDPLALRVTITIGDMTDDGVTYETSLRTLAFEDLIDLHTPGDDGRSPLSDAARVGILKFIAALRVLADDLEADPRMKKP